MTCWWRTLMAWCSGANLTNWGRAPTTEKILIDDGTTRTVINLGLENEWPPETGGMGLEAHVFAGLHVGKGDGPGLVEVLLRPQLVQDLFSDPAVDRHQHN